MTLASHNVMPHHDRTMAMTKATKAWLDTVAEGSDHESRYACEVFAAFESGDGRVSRDALRWLGGQSKQRRYPLVRIAAASVISELSALRLKVS